MAKKPPKILDAHRRQLLALFIIAIVWVATRSVSLPNRIILIWISYAGTILALDWIIILTRHPTEVRKKVQLEDSSITFVFIFIIGAAFVSLFAVITLIISGKGNSASQTTEHALLAIGSVGVSWWLTHTVFTLHYAHLFYTKKDGTDEYESGLEFPKELCPDYLDFVYFSFVIGMTFQVSDVEISSRRIRRLAWAHGILSFVFNTVIVALSINIISGMFGH